MDSYSLERWMVERHESVSRNADAHGRRRAWAPTPRLAGLMAARLRSLADRLDRPERASTVVSGSR